MLKLVTIVKLQNHPTKYSVPLWAILSKPYLFITLAHFTKYLFLQPMPSAKSTNVIDYFENYILDNAKKFISKEMQDFFELFGVTHIRTGLYSPQANAAERVNREIISKIRFYLKDQPDHCSWDKCIPRILGTLRSDFHSSIQCSPYYAMFVQNMCMHDSTYTLLDKLNVVVDDTIVTRTDKLSDIRNRVGQEIFRRSHNLSTFEKGVNAKFSPKYIKCRIRAQVGKALYNV